LIALYEMPNWISGKKQGIKERILVRKTIYQKNRIKMIPEVSHIYRKEQPKIGTTQVGVEYHFIIHLL
jgi:hypothetical protein